MDGPRGLLRFASDKLAYLFVTFFLTIRLNGIPQNIIERANEIYDSFLNLEKNLRIA